MSTIIASNVSDGTLSIPTTYVTNGSAKAWVNFNGTGTIAARDSLNLSSLTDNGTGDYTVNFSSAMGNASYFVGGSCSLGSTPANSAGVVAESMSGSTTYSLKTTSAINIVTGDNNTDNIFDAFTANVLVQGDLA